MQIMVLGQRGFPGIPGGIEAHCEHLYSRLRGSYDLDIEVVVRSPYWPEDRERVAVNGITYRRLWSPRMKGVEAFVHTFLGVLYAGLKRPDILHIHALGPAFFTPLAKLLGLRVIVTHHGADYEREKWNAFARFILKSGERLAVRWADEIIVISRGIQDALQTEYGREAALIPNGVDVPSSDPHKHVLRSFGLKRGRYIVTVSRIVPEKRHLDLIAAFEKCELDEWNLVIVGDLGGDTYSRAVTEEASKAERVVLTGFQTGDALQALYANAGLFVLPSTHEGLPIALLEALSYGLPVLVSDIPAHLEVGLDEDRYFRVGDVDDLAGSIALHAHRAYSEVDQEKTKHWVCSNFNWDRVAESTMRIYQESLDYHGGLKRAE